jgi:hypothetical protein
MRAGGQGHDHAEADQQRDDAAQAAPMGVSDGNAPSRPCATQGAPAPNGHVTGGNTSLRR